MSSAPNQVLKRNGTYEELNENKIKQGIIRSMSSGSGIYNPKLAALITDDVFNKVGGIYNVSTQVIEDEVRRSLEWYGQALTSQAFVKFRELKEYRKKGNEIIESVMGIVNRTNEAVIKENANKNFRAFSTQRDLSAGEVSKLIARHIIPEHLMLAHQNGIIHIHDLDYFGGAGDKDGLQAGMFNCFSGDTTFVTFDGIRKFHEVGDGNKVQVLDKNGEWREATVRSYGEQQLQKVTLRSNSGTMVSVKVTPNHRWVLQNGEVTTEINKGDKLIGTPSIAGYMPTNPGECCYWISGFIKAAGIGNALVINSKTHDMKRTLEVFRASGCLESTKILSNEDTMAMFSSVPEVEYGKWGGLKPEYRKAYVHGLIYALYDRGQIRVTDTKMLDLILELSCIAGYHKTKILTHYEGGKHSYIVGLEAGIGYWEVAAIQDLGEKETVWCVEEPETKTFTLESGIVTGNCCLVDLKDMLNNGTVIGSTAIGGPQGSPEEIHMFSKAATIASQIALGISSGQYGGQTMSISHLSSFIKKTREKFREFFSKVDSLSKEQIEELVENAVKKDIRDGVKTLNHQLNTFVSTNGQTPFISLFMYINEDPDCAEDTAMVIEEILKQRIIGLPNKKGYYVAQSFPKLLYVLDENNVAENSKYYYLTELVSECMAKSMAPDLISAKVMREQHQGNVFPCMGK